MVDSNPITVITSLNVNELNCPNKFSYWIQIQNSNYNATFQAALVVKNPAANAETAEMQGLIPGKIP